MATQAILTFSDGKLEIPVEVQEAINLKEGAKLRLVMASPEQLVVAPSMTRELPEWTWEPNDRWQSGQGLLSDHPEHETSSPRAAERAWEREHDERKFGSS